MIVGHVVAHDQSPPRSACRRATFTPSVDPVADPGGLAAGLADQLDVRDVDEQLLSMMPPCWSCWPLVERLPLVRVCFFARATPSTMTRPSRGSTWTTRPRLPRSLPGDDLHLVVVLDVDAGHGYSTSGASEMIFMNRFSRSSRATGPKMRVPARVPLLVDQHDRVVVEPDVRAVRAAALLRGANDDGLDDLALLHARRRAGRPSPSRRSRRRRRRTGARSRRARGCTGPPWPPCCPRPCSASPAGSPVRQLPTSPARRPRPRASAWSWTAAASP